MKYTLILIFVSCNVHLLLAQRSECLPAKDELIPYRVKDKWGYSDINGKLIIPVQFDSAGLFGDNKEKKSLARVKSGSKYLLIDKLGKEVLDSVTEDKKALIKDAIILLILAEQSRAIDIYLNSNFKNGKYGFIEEKDTVIRPVYNDFAFNDKDLVALKADKWILFNTNGKALTKAIYDTIYDFNGSEITVFKRKGKCGLMDRQGHELVNPKYRDIHPFSRDHKLLVARNNKGKYGLIDRKGKVVEGFKYTYITKYHFLAHKLFQVYFDDNNFGYINCDGLKYFE